MSAGGVHYPGTYLAGCYDRLCAEVADQHIDNADLVNVPNWLPLTFRAADGDWFDLDRAFADGRLLSYRQELNLRRGVLTRLLRWRDTAGRMFRLGQRRIMSMADPHLAALETTIVAEDWTGALQVRSALDGRVANTGVARYRGLPAEHLTQQQPVPPVDPELLSLSTTTVTSKIGIALAARTRAFLRPRRTFPAFRGGLAGPEPDARGPAGVSVTIEKVAAVFTSRDRPVEEHREAAVAATAQADGFDALLRRHDLVWTNLWRRAQLRLDHTSSGFSICTCSTCCRLCRRTRSIWTSACPPAGCTARLTAATCSGKLSILPFLTMRFPEIAKALLMYRYRRLPAARRAARAAGHRDAMYPWQSAADGREESQQVHLNPRSGRWLPDHSHLQRHVGLAIAHNVWRFYEATGDAEFLAEYGTEMLLEIARYFADLACYDRSADRYRIRGVMGPDEYHDAYPGRDGPGLDDNAYTNVLTAWILRRALDALALIPEDRRTELRERLGLTREEINRFQDVSQRLYVPFHDGVISQFDGYAGLEELDWPRYQEGYGDVRQLDRILEAEGDSTNRYKASKQADVLMLLYVLTPGELDDVLQHLRYSPDPDLQARTIGYYLPRTCYGSSLSSLVHAWILANTDGQQAWRVFLEALEEDIGDARHGITAEGVHLGAMAGTVDLVQRCYAGLRTQGDTLPLAPRLPPAIGELGLTLRYHKHWGVDLDCRQDRLRISLRRSAAQPIHLAYGSHDIVIAPGESWETPLDHGRTIKHDR